MIGAWLRAVVLAACPAATQTPGSPGTPSVAPAPSAAAQALNAEGKQLYRQRRWDEARSRYRAALAADPAFLPAALNLACALASQERFGEAAEEAASLVRRGYVPWGREVLEAADLAPLHERPEMAVVRRALADAAVAWGSSLGDAVFFVARTRPPVRLPRQGMLVLALGQEVFAWLPRTGGYRQVTAEDGRVLALARSPDGRTLVYVRAGKLLRGPGTTPVLRALSLRRLEVPAMALGAPVTIPDDVTALELRIPSGTTPEVRLQAAGQWRVFHLQGEVLVPATAPAAPGPPAVELDAAGVSAQRESLHLPGCGHLRAADDRSGPVARVRVTGRRTAIELAARFGAGLAGLPLGSN
jgi:hypothetical protein